MAPSVIRLSCISLFSMGPKLDNFCTKKFSFGSSPLPLSKILAAPLVAFIAAYRFFKQLYRLDTKRAKNAAGLNVSFFRHEHKIVKIAHNLSRDTSVFVCKSSVYYSAPPHFRLVPPHFGCSADGTDLSTYDYNGVCYKYSL